jgi:hypothetical protein
MIMVFVLVFAVLCMDGRFQVFWCRPDLKPPTSSRVQMSDGAILELISRGKKDAYQIQNPKHTWFGSPYEKRSPSTREIRRIYPENAPRFGQSFDIVLPPDGDVLMSLDLRITMPTWLPPSIAELNAQPRANNIKILSDPYVIQTNPIYPGPPTPPYVAPAAYTHYGWCDGVANYIINRWALFVDNIMILEGYGEFNTWFPDMDTSQLQAPLLHASTGRVQNNIQVNATFVGGIHVAASTVFLQ